MSDTEDQMILTEIDNHVAIATLNRPKVLNALNPELMGQLAEQFTIWDKDKSIHCILLSGSEKAWAAGADIADMCEQSAISMYERDQFATWEIIKRVKTPIVAAVSGWALGGGCELMMHCDVVIASETTQFGQPEINLGVMPGAGGTQRLTRAVGKALAMDMILSGRFISAHEALQYGLISRVVPVEHFKTEALKVAHQIASKAPIALKLAKEGVLKAFETPLSAGLEYERKLFYTLFATEDQKEGMRAFVDKRKPIFTGS